MSWINIRFSADQPVPVILRVSEMESSGIAKQSVSRVFWYSIHPVEFIRCTSCRSCMCRVSCRNTVFCTGTVIVTADVYTPDNHTAVIFTWAGKPTGSDMIFVR